MMINIYNSRMNIFKQSLVIITILLSISVKQAMAHPNATAESDAKQSISDLCVVKTQPTYAVAFSPKRGAMDLIISAIMTAEKSVHVAAFAFTSQPIADALVAAQKRGVFVKVLLDKKQANDKNNQLNFLKKNKIEVRTGNSKMMHNKYIIIDANSVQTGSFNYSNSAENSNAENVLVIYNAPCLAEKYLKDWNRLWLKAK